MSATTEPVLCVRMQVDDNVLYVEPPTMRHDGVSDVDIAVQRLACGEKVFVTTAHDLPARVQRTIRMMLGAQL
jgi:hypothetical protein